MKAYRALCIVAILVGAGLLLAGVTFGVRQSAGVYAQIVVGALTAAIGLAFVLRSIGPTDNRWEPATVERGILVPRPGDDLLAAGEPAIRDRFHALVGDALVRDGHSPDEARTAIAEGTWTTATDATDYLRARPAKRLPDGQVLDNHRAVTLEELERLRDDHD